MLPGFWVIASEASKPGLTNKPKKATGRQASLCGAIMFKNSGSHAFSFQEQGPHTVFVQYTLQEKRRKQFCKVVYNDFA